MDLLYATPLPLSPSPLPPSGRAPRNISILLAELQEVFQAVPLENCGGDRKTMRLGQATGTGLVVVLGEHLCQLLLVKVGVKLCLRLLYLVEVVVQCLLLKHVGLLLIYL